MSQIPYVSINIAIWILKFQNWMFLGIVPYTMYTNYNNKEYPFANIEHEYLVSGTLPGMQ